MKNLKSVLEGYVELVQAPMSYKVQSFLTASLISLLEEVVPERKVEKKKDGRISLRAEENRNGWNACRQKLLDNIATITKL